LGSIASRPRRCRGLEQEVTAALAQPTPELAPQRFLGVEARARRIDQVEISGAGVVFLVDHLIVEEFKVPPQVTSSLAMAKWRTWAIAWPPLE